MLPRVRLDLGGAFSWSILRATCRAASHDAQVEQRLDVRRFGARTRLQVALGGA